MAYCENHEKNDYRIEQLETAQAKLSDSVQELMLETVQIKADIKDSRRETAELRAMIVDIKTQVDKLVALPAKRYEGIVSSGLSAAAGAIVSALVLSLKG